MRATSPCAYDCARAKPCSDGSPAAFTSHSVRGAPGSAFSVTDAGTPRATSACGAAHASTVASATSAARPLARITRPTTRLAIRIPDTYPHRPTCVATSALRSQCGSTPGRQRYAKRNCSFYGR